SGEPLIDNLEAYRKAILCNPWLEEFPMLLEGVVPGRYDGKWILRDAEGSYLPLSPNFEHRYALLALSGNYPITVAGAWDGIQLLPSSVIANGRFIDLNLVDETLGDRKRPGG